MADNLTKNSLRSSFVCCLIYMTYATQLTAEISFGGEENRASTPLAHEPSYFPVSTCRRVEDEGVLKIGSQLFSEQVRKKLGSPMSAYSDFPNLISLDDCGDFFLLTSVLGRSTMGERIRITLPRAGSLFSGSIDEENILLFYSRGAQ